MDARQQIKVFAGLLQELDVFCYRGTHERRARLIPHFFSVKVGEGRHVFYKAHAARSPALFSPFVPAVVQHLEVRRSDDTTSTAMRRSSDGI